MIKDLQYAARTLLKRPGFLVIAISTLALGIGATTAMFGRQLGLAAAAAIPGTGTHRRF